MQETNKKKKKAAVLKSHCVACGCCVKACPFKAISIINGSFAQIDHSRCVGCGKCANVCPASVIKIEEVAQ